MNIDGAWIDTKLRKIMVPPSQVSAVLEALPKSEDFEWI
jgi:hypothetical protein